MKNPKPRVPAIPPQEWTEPAREAVAVLSEPMSQLGKKSSDNTDVVPNVLRTFANYPALIKEFLPFNRFLLKEGVLSPRSRELVILRVGWLRQAEYEWAQHVRMGRTLGISDDEINRLTQTLDPDQWSPEDALLIRATDELIESALISDETWAGLKKYLDQQQLIELLFVVGNYDMMAMVFNNCGIELEENLQGLGFDHWG